MIIPSFVVDAIYNTFFLLQLPSGLLASYAVRSIQVSGEYSLYSSVTFGVLRVIILWLPTV
jgi:hypothetical protein